MAKPKTLRYRLWHTAVRLVRHRRRLILCLQPTWPWTQELVRRSGGCDTCRHAADHPPRCEIELVGEVLPDTTWC